MHGFGFCGTAGAMVGRDAGDVTAARRRVATSVVTLSVRPDSLSLATFLSTAESPVGTAGGTTAWALGTDCALRVSSSALVLASSAFWLLMRVFSSPMSLPRSSINSAAASGWLATATTSAGSVAAARAAAMRVMNMGSPCAHSVSAPMSFELLSVSARRPETVRVRRLILSAVGSYRPVWPTVPP